MSHRQITHEERYSIAHYLRQGYSQKEMAKLLKRHPSTISRELGRNGQIGTGRYYHYIAQKKAQGRRRFSRYGPQFTKEEWGIVCHFLAEDWSPEQISLTLRKHRVLRMSHETIYRYIWRDKKCGGTLYKHLRQSSKKRRKRYRAYDSRGVLRGKRGLDQRPETANERLRKGHFEGDLVHGVKDRDCILTLVDRKTRLVIIRKLRDKAMKDVADAMVKLIRRYGILTITLDNGTEFHDYERVERLTGVKFYFAAPYHSWERGTSENTNGLIRQYIPKTASMKGITQRACNNIAGRLNNRPRKILGLNTPEGAHYGHQLKLRFTVDSGHYTVSLSAASAPFAKEYGNFAIRLLMSTPSNSSMSVQMKGFRT
jgi:IS30 family transposase